MSHILTTEEEELLLNEAGNILSAEFSATVGAMSAPFGTPMIASTKTVGSTTTYRLAQFSGYTIASNWYSIVMPTGQGRNMGMVDAIVVKTNPLGTDARCDLIVQYNQAGTNSSTFQITGADKTRHTFKICKTNLEDIKIYLNWVNGSTTNVCKIKDITLEGHWVQR